MLEFAGKVTKGVGRMACSESQMLMGELDPRSFGVPGIPIGNRCMRDFSECCGSGLGDVVTSDGCR